MFKEIYTTHVKTKLEFGLYFWNPLLKSVVDKLERVQNCAARMIPDLAGLLYEQRLKLLQLPS